MRLEHKPSLHEDWIDHHAFNIVRNLQKAGFQTYLVGGCVRDLLLGIHPKDYDIVTMAQPKEVRSYVHNAYIIGRRFLLVLVKRDGQQYEIATFRKETKTEEAEGEEVPFGDNTFGTPEEDARRRDFTINALFYDPIKADLIDHVEGLKDIQARQLRMIGLPDVRLREDPIRILRALRLSHKLDLQIEPELRLSMLKNAESLQRSVLPRRREEILKILKLDSPARAILEAFDLDVLKFLSPFISQILTEPTRQELFLKYIDDFKNKLPTKEPQHLMALLVFTSLFVLAETGVELTAVNQGDANAEYSAQHKWLHLFRSREFSEFMRNELGMFKLEQAFAGHVLKLFDVLNKVESFQKRGPRRLLSILREESFTYALELMSAHFLLSGSEVLFWRESYFKLAPEIEELRPVRVPRRRRPRRDRPNKPAQKNSDS